MDATSGKPDNRGVRADLEATFARHIDDLTGSDPFRRLESGEAPREEYDRFLANLIRSHASSPPLIGFLYALAPPAARADVLHNLLEELGLEDDEGVAHPAMLGALAAGAGLTPVLPELERLAELDLRQIASEPLLYGTLREVGLAALCEIVAFELMLSQVARRIERFLADHRDLAPEALAWFSHHAEADIAHAEQGLAHIEAYVRHYGIGEEDAGTIIELTMRDNPFLKRYFRQVSPTTVPAAP